MSTPERNLKRASSALLVTAVLLTALAVTTVVFSVVFPRTFFLQRDAQTSTGTSEIALKVGLQDYAFLLALRYDREAGVAAPGIRGTFWTTDAVYVRDRHRYERLSTRLGFYAFADSHTYGNMTTSRLAGIGAPFWFLLLLAAGAYALRRGVRSRLRRAEQAAGVELKPSDAAR